MENKKVLRKLQLTELEILDVISCFCKERGISWFMDSGTCLGAVRHGGFIPWDDDIDIGMLREDYDVFCEAAARELPDGYSLHTPLNTNNYAPLTIGSWPLRMKEEGRSGTHRFPKSALIYITQK